MEWLFFFCLTVMSISLITGVINYKKLNLAFRWVFFACFFALCTELLGLYISHISETNMLVYYLANPIETMLFVSFYISLTPRAYIKYAGTGTIICFFLISLIVLFFFKGSPMTSLYFTAAKGLIISVFSVLYLQELLAEDEVEKNDLNTLVIAAGILFYYSCSSIYFCIYNYQINQEIDLNEISRLRPFLYITYIIHQCATLFSFIRAGLKKAV